MNDTIVAGLQMKDYVTWGIVIIVLVVIMIFLAIGTGKSKETYVGVS